MRLVACCLLLAGCTLNAYKDDELPDEETDVEETDVAAETDPPDDTLDDTDPLADTDDTNPPVDTDLSGSVGYCHVQFPCTMQLESGQVSDTVYGWFYSEGVTEGQGAGAGLEVDVGVGPDGSNPSGSGWTWTDASFNTDKDNNDEWSGLFTAPSSAGTYDFVMRARVGTGDWTYCDLGNDGEGSCGTPATGSSDGYQTENAPELTVVGAR